MSNSPAHHYRRIFTSRSPAELEQLAHVKRFVERFSADDGFRAGLESAGDSAPDWAARHGVAVDPRDLSPLWRLSATGLDAGQIDESEWPLVAAYIRFVSDLRHHRALTREQGAATEAPQRYRLWRQRQIARCASEIPSSAEFITHAVAAFELSEGCSKGCWFCGVSAEKFAGNFPYDAAGRALWQDIVRATYDIFGEASQTAFCYWATDPSDHPDYLAFARDVAEITGCVPESTTAAPLKDIELTRGLIRLARERPSAPVRFSVVSLRSLDEIHRTFDARELLDVQLICQNRESLNVVAWAGRAREARRVMDERGAGSDLSNVRLQRMRAEHATIACVSGFLVNMVAGTVALISPTKASDRWPLGYRTHDRRHFRSGDDFRAQIEAMIERHMPEAPEPTMPVAFRGDLAYAAKPGDPPARLRLQSPWAAHETDGPPYLAALGRLIAEGGQNLGSLKAQLAEAGVPGDDVARVLQHLFDQGFLDDEPAVS